MSEDGYSLLMATIRNDLDEVIRLLSYYKIDVDFSLEDKFTALHFATVKGNLAIVKLLIKNEANVNSINNQGDTAFTLASKNGFVEIAKLLIKNGADINSINQDDETAFTLASKYGHVKIVKLLIENRAEIDETNIGHAIIVAAATNNWTEVYELTKTALVGFEIEFDNTIGECHKKYEMHTNERVKNLYTFEKWDPSDIFVKLSDGYCYSIKEIRNFYLSYVEESPYNRKPYSKRDNEIIEFIGKLLLPIEPFEPDSEKNERKGGYIKRKRHTQKTNKIRHACAKKNKNTHKKNTHKKKKKKKHTQTNT